MADSARTGRSARRPDPVDVSGLPPLTQTRLADDVADIIRKLIISEDIAEGSRLPSERDLAERIGASRPTVSQALRTLALMGLVEIRRGSGAYVVRKPGSMVTASVTLMLDLDEHSATDLMQLRFWLENLGVREAAGRAPTFSEAEVTGMREALDRLTDAAGDASQWIAADTVFHATVVRASSNLYLAEVYESVHTTLLRYEYKQWVQTERVPEWLRTSDAEQQLALHKPILDGVLDNDPAAACAAVERHHHEMQKHLEAALDRSHPSS